VHPQAKGASTLSQCRVTHSILARFEPRLPNMVWHLKQIQRHEMSERFLRRLDICHVEIFGIVLKLLNLKSFRSWSASGPHAQRGQAQRGGTRASGTTGGSLGRKLWVNSLRQEPTKGLS